MKLKSTTRIKLKAAGERKYFSKAAAVITEAASKTSLGDLRKQREKVFPASNYNPKAYRNQTITATFSKHGVVLQTNRDDTLIQEYPIAPGSFNADMMHDALESYRNSNNMKCARYAFFVENEGKTYDNQTQFLNNCKFHKYDPMYKKKSS